MNHIFYLIAGVLPRGKLHEAYSSALAVLATTVQSQSAMGMINNRIFEALSCGNIVISDYSDILNETFGDVLQFVHDAEDVDAIMKRLVNPRNAEYFENVRQRSRRIILNGHTWKHRVIEIFSFFLALKDGMMHLSSPMRMNGRSSDIKAQVLDFQHQSQHSLPLILNTSSPRSVPLLAWIVSDHLKSHVDYLFFVRLSIDLYFADKFIVHEYTERKWLDVIHARNANDNMDLIHKYSIIFVTMSHMDSLHKAIISFHQWHQDNNNNEAIPVKNHSSDEVLDRTLQKYVSYIIGIDERHSQMELDGYVNGDFEDNRGVFLSELFDLTLFRDDFEKKILENLEKNFYEKFINEHCHCDDIITEQSNNPLRESSFQKRSCDFSLRIEHVNSFRWQVCFGIWDQPTEKSLSDISDDNDNDNYVAICLWNQKQYCVERRRSTFVPPHVNYTLLLVGGTLSSWASYCEEESSSTSDITKSCVLDNTHMSRVVHIENCHNEFIEDKLYNVTEIFFIFHEDIHHTNISEMQDSYDTYNLFINTKDDVIWPLIYSGTHQKSIRLAKQPLAHMSSLIKNAAWNRIPVMLQWKRVLNIALTFGSVKTTCEFVTNYLDPFCSSNKTITKYREIYASDLHEDPFTENNLVALVKFKNFVPGLDGQACFFHDGVFTYCRYSRGNYLLDLNLHHLTWSESKLKHAAALSRFSHVDITTTLRIELRGVLYLQHFFVMERNYTFCLPNPYFLGKSTQGISLDIDITDVLEIEDTMSPSFCRNGTMNTLFDKDWVKQFQIGHRV